MRGQPDLNLLPLFVAVAETGSMSAAARRLELAKSTVSRSIAALEDSLGVQLIHRTTRNVAVTSAGRAFYDKAKPLVSSLRDLTGSLPEQDVEPRGELRITAPVDMASTWLAEAAAEFALRFPSIDLDVRPTNRYVDLVAESYDAALRVARKLADSTVVARRLGAVEMGLYASPVYVARRGQPRTAGETQDHDWVLLLSQRARGPLDHSEHPRLLTDDLMFAYAAIRSGMGIGILPRFLAQRDLATGQLVRLLPRWRYDPFSLFFIYPATQHVPRKVAAWRDFVIAYLAAHPLSAGR